MTVSFRGRCTSNTPFERAVDVLWWLNDPAHHATLAGSCGWPDEDYRAWLADQMKTALLDR